MSSDIPYLKLFRSVGTKAVYQPRWEPGPKLRGANLKGRALKDNAGQWLQPDAARAEAERLNAEAARIIASGKRQRPQGPRRHPRSVEALWETYKASPKWAAKADATKADYEAKARFLLAEFGEVPVAAIEHSHLYSWWETLHASRSHAMANGVLAVTRLLLSYAVKRGWRRDNPALKLGLESLSPRVVVWLPAETEAFVAAADRLGKHGVADAFVLALHTSQRLADVLALAEHRCEGEKVRFLQSKTGARVTVPLTDQLSCRLAEIRRRPNAAGVVEIGRAGPLVRRPDGSEYDRFSFNKDFRTVRDEVEELHADAGDKEFRDLRDTAITRLCEARCEVYEIAAISGHSINTIHQVLRHYVVLSEAMAISGIDRLKTYMHEQGIAI